MSVAGTMINDIEARNRVIERLKDRVLDFLLSYIPTININSLDGVYENISYHISSLDLSGFKFQKEKVFLDIDQDPLANDGSLLRFKASSIEASFKGVEWKYAQQVFPNLQGEGLINAAMESASLSLGFKFARVPKGTRPSWQVAAASATTRLRRSRSSTPFWTTRSSASCGSRRPRKRVPYRLCRSRAARVLVLPRAQTPVPRLLSRQPNPLRRAAPVLSAQLLPPAPPALASTTGEDDVDDEVKKADNPWGNKVQEWEPVLLINELDIVIDEFDTSIEQDGLSWIYNFLVALFKRVQGPHLQGPGGPHRLQLRLFVAASQHHGDQPLGYHPAVRLQRLRCLQPAHVQQQGLHVSSRARARPGCLGSDLAQQRVEPRSARKAAWASSRRAHQQHGSEQLLHGQRGHSIVSPSRPSRR